MSSALYLRTNEHEEAVRSLEWAEVQARALTADPYLWKWVFISLHNTVQGFMVLALWNGNGLLALRDRAAARWLEAYRNGDPFPAENLDEFLNLYSKVKQAKNFSTVGAGPFTPGPSHDASLQQLNQIRNVFTHFTPKGWSLQLAGLPRICLDSLELVQFLGWDSTAILWYRRIHLVRAKRALKRLRRTMLVLAGQNGG